MITSIRNAFCLKGKNALITGGNRGIGKGIAIAMAQSGANVAIMARDRSAAQKALGELSEYGGVYRFYSGDVTKIGEAKHVVESMQKDYGKIDILVNNSGIVRWFKVLEADESLKDWYDVINVNLNGVFIMSYLVGKVMKENGGGSIINISSNASRIVNLPQSTSSYSSAKAAVDHLTRCLAYEFAPYKIRVNAICPGFTYSDMAPDIDNLEELENFWLERTPTGRFNQPIELGALAVFLASEAAEQMTGSINTMDGGYELAR